MKKALLLLTVLSLPTLLTGCGVPDQVRKERCTELSGESSDAIRGHGDRKQSEIRKEWDELQCHRTDIIQG